MAVYLPASSLEKWEKGADLKINLSPFCFLLFAFCLTLFFRPRIDHRKMITPHRYAIT